MAVFRPDGTVRAVVSASTIEELEAQLGPEETLGPPPEPIKETE